MVSIRDFFDSFKEFVWDIIGFLLPGSYLVILVSFCVEEKYHRYFSASYLSGDFVAFPGLIISYVLGYIVYGFGLTIDKLLGQRSYTKRIESRIEKRSDFNSSIEIIKKLKAKKGMVSDSQVISVRIARSLVMSFIPDQDQKIYTFMSRSELSKHTANVSMIVGTVGLVYSICPSMPFKLLRTGELYLLTYILLVLSSLLLTKTRNRFYEIAMGIPFSIFLAYKLKK